MNRNLENWLRSRQNNINIRSINHKPKTTNAPSPDGINKQSGQNRYGRPKSQGVVFLSLMGQTKSKTKPVSPLVKNVSFLEEKGLLNIVTKNISQKKKQKKVSTLNVFMKTGMAKVSPGNSVMKMPDFTRKRLNANS